MDCLGLSKIKEYKTILRADFLLITLIVNGYPVTEAPATEA